MASHVHSDGWNLDSDQVEQDTGYLHMFSSPGTTQLKKKVQQADDTDCLEHDCSGAGTDAHMQKEEREEAREEKEEEAQIKRRARDMDKFAKMSSVPPSIRAFLAKKRKGHAHSTAHAHRPVHSAAQHVRLTKVEKLVAKRQKALLAAKGTLTRMVRSEGKLPALPARAHGRTWTSRAQGDSRHGARHARIRANIEHIRSLEKIAPLPGMGDEGPRAAVSSHARARGRSQQASLQAQEKGVRLLAKKWAAKRKAAQDKMLHEAEMAQHKLQAARQKLI
eukprot:Tamp_24595.p1 GENE.Tamp_24595~~Tamp_24595.p1  ORF type:complete len:325 (+),score=73.38 Tamp_24595:142-975(+)